MENKDKTERLRDELQKAMEPVMERLDRIESELKQLKEQQNK